MLAVNIKRWRVSMSQTEFAEKLGFTQSAISQWESGEREPDIATLQKLSEILGVTLDELVNGSEKQEAA